MKFTENKSLILLFVLIIGLVIGFSACNVDEEIIPKTMEEYKSKLSAIVTSEKVKVENCIVGYNKGDFRTELYYADYRYNYMAALVAAQTVLAKTDLTIADLVAANRALTAPGKAFNDNLFISDRRPLQEVIVVSDTLRVHTPEGTEVGQAPAAARNVFMAAISKAKTIRGASTTIERQVTEAVDELNLELTKFRAAIKK